MEYVSCLCNSLLNTDFSSTSFALLLFDYYHRRSPHHHPCSHARLIFRTVCGYVGKFSPLSMPSLSWPCAIYMRSEIYTLMLTLEKIITNYLRMQKRLYVSIEFAISDVHTSLHAIPCTSASRNLSWSRSTKWSRSFFRSLSFGKAYTSRLCYNKR